MSVKSNKTKNAKLREEFFIAVYYNDVEKVRSFIYDRSMKHKFNLGEYSVDLMNLTFFNRTIWYSTGWDDKIKPFIEENRHKTKRMLDYWQEEFGCQKIQRTCEYNQYWHGFYCEDPNVTDEISGKPFQYYLSEGFREIDLMLYNRAECFDFVETKKLLKRGANHKARIFDDGGILTRISHECSFLESQIVPDFQNFNKNGYKHRSCIGGMFEELLGLAAHQDMYDLLAPYSKE